MRDHAADGHLARGGEDQCLAVAQGEQAVDVVVAVEEVLVEDADAVLLDFGGERRGSVPQALPNDRYLLEYEAGGGEEIIPVEVDFAPGSTLEFDGKTYNFRQFHFHTPSEHQVDGITYAMEMHMVHTLEGDENTYLVIGLLFKNGEQNAFLDSFLDALPQVEGGKVMKEPGAVDITSVVSADEPFFHYAGSLTTPPYTESVTWLVAEQPRDATEDQIQAFRAIEKNNARVVQSRNGRTIDEV